MHGPRARAGRRVPLALALPVVLPLAAAGPALGQVGPPETGPLPVSIGLHIVDIIDINADEQTFEFDGILTLRWTDPRLAAPAGSDVGERVYQGWEGFPDRFPGWWPQLILRNQSGRNESQALVVRLGPDGSVEWTSEIQASAEARLDLRKIPFDRQTFEMTFEVLGAGSDQVTLVPALERTGIGLTTLSQWRVGEVAAAAEETDPAYLGDGDARVSAVTFALPLDRSPSFLLRLVVFPVMLLIALSWSVFWMDRESLGDRMDISFIGILTVVAFELVVSDRLPRISYVTLLNCFMYTSYLMLAASVFVNLRVAALDKRGDPEPGNRLDRRCRWLFPLLYLGTLAVATTIFLAV